MPDLYKLFKILNIKPKDEHIFVLALTHPSYNADVNTKHFDYERLEYMGDAVLDYVSADLIFNEFPEMEPGNMSKLRSFLVKSHTLSNYARNIGLANYIIVGRSITQKQIASSDKILEDCFEALIGAIYVDQGMDFVYRYIKGPGLL